MADDILTPKYRITSRGGTLYVRDSWTGAVIGRITSLLSTENPSNIPEIIAACGQFFLSAVESAVHDKETVQISCKAIEPARDEIRG